MLSPLEIKYMGLITENSELEQKRNLEIILGAWVFENKRNLKHEFMTISIFEGEKSTKNCVQKSLLEIQKKKCRNEE